MRPMARRRRRRTRLLALGVLLLVAAVLVHRYGAWPIEITHDYDRSDWPHWIDEDDDCQDTRQEVLIAESTIPVRFADARHCKVASGRWVCPYTGRVFTDPHELDVDHMVPLHAAHEAGGDAWDLAARRRYANALDDGDHLIAVHKAANRSKSDKGPDRWLPEAAAYRCPYVRNWVRIKTAWGLESAPAEGDAIASILATCDAGRVPPRPGESRA
jgi:hypothetical protein